MRFSNEETVSKQNRVNKTFENHPIADVAVLARASQNLGRFVSGTPAESMKQLRQLVEIINKVENTLNPKEQVLATPRGNARKTVTHPAEMSASGAGARKTKGAEIRKRAQSVAGDSNASEFTKEMTEAFLQDMRNRLEDLSAITAEALELQDLSVQFRAGYDGALRIAEDIKTKARGPVDMMKANYMYDQSVYTKEKAESLMEVARNVATLMNVSPVSSELSDYERTILEHLKSGNAEMVSLMNNVNALHAEKTSVYYNDFIPAKEDVEAQKQNDLSKHEIYISSRRDRLPGIFKHAVKSKPVVDSEDTKEALQNLSEAEKNMGSIDVKIDEGNAKLKNARNEQGANVQKACYQDKNALSDPKASVLRIGIALANDRMEKIEQESKNQEKYNARVEKVITETIRIDTGNDITIREIKRNVVSDVGIGDIKEDMDKTMNRVNQGMVNPELEKVYDQELKEGRREALHLEETLSQGRKRAGTVVEQGVTKLNLKTLQTPDVEQSRARAKSISGYYGSQAEARQEKQTLGAKDKQEVDTKAKQEVDSPEIEKPDNSDGPKGPGF